MEDRLCFILLNASDWLKFAESKNAALLAGNGVVIFGLLSLVDGKQFLCAGAKYYFYSALSMVVLSALVCLISFLPKLSIPWLFPKRISNARDNLVFYGDIAIHDPPTYLRALYNQVGPELDHTDPFEADLAEQVIINSRIALKKYHLFSLAVWLDVTALLTPVFAIMLWICFRKAAD
jgi:hypothetical protein